MNMAWINQWLWLTGFSPSIFLPFDFVPSCVGCWGGAGLTPEAQNKYTTKMHRCRFIRGHFFQFHYLTLKRNSMCSFVLASYRWRKYDMIWYDIMRMVWWYAGTASAMVTPRISNHSDQEMSSFQELIGELSLSRSAILKAWDAGTLMEGLRWHLVHLCWLRASLHNSSALQAMVFCVDRSMSSLTIAQKIGASITEAALALFQTCFFVLSDVSEWRRTSGIIVCFSDTSFSVMVFGKAQSGLTTQQLVARMYLLNDVRQTLPNLIGCIMLCLWPCPACADLMKLAVANLITCFLSGGFRFCTTRIVSDSAWHSFISNSKMIPQLALGWLQAISAMSITKAWFLRHQTWSISIPATISRFATGLHLIISHEELCFSTWTVAPFVRMWWRDFGRPLTLWPGKKRGKGG